MSLRTSTITSTVEKEREKDKVSAAAKPKGVKGPVCEYAKCCTRFPTMHEIVKDDLPKDTDWKTSKCDGTSPAITTAPHALKGKTYELCNVHGMLVDMYEHVHSEGQETNKPGGEPVKL